MMKEMMERLGYDMDARGSVSDSSKIGLGKFGGLDLFPIDVMAM
jgi:hypothetical protein